MDEVFRALADPSRRRLLDRLHEQNGQSLRELCAGLAMTRQSVSKHLDVLETANLVTSLRRGREKLHYLNVAPINDIADRWINRYDQGRVAALADLKRALEETEMTVDTAVEKPAFVYTSYIRTTPERVWAALTDPVFVGQWWKGTLLDSTWEVGAPVKWTYKGVEMAHPEQVVVECEPMRKLSYMWHSFTPEFGELVGWSPEQQARLAAEPRSKVTFEMESLGGKVVKLTVVHDGFMPGSEVLAGISQGWPWLLSDLKTLLETGENLPDAADAA